MRIGVLGINHKLAGVRLRERIAKACHNLFQEARPEGGEAICVLLSTCNRSEIYFSTDDLAERHTQLLAMLRSEMDESFEHKLYSYFGLDCFHHLAHVTAGLDSAIVGESEIQRQVKMAYQAASSKTYLSSDLHFMFQKCLRIGKKVRTAFPLGGRFEGVESVILRSAREHFADLAQRRILFIGASDINDKVLHHFKSAGEGKIAVCNRSLDRALEWADAKKIDVCDWRALGRWSEYDVVVVGTRYSDFLLMPDDLREERGPKLIVDLSVPRNVHPGLARTPGVTLLNIDQIDRRVEKGRVLKAALLREMEELVERAVERYVGKFQTKTSHPHLQIVAAS